MFLRIHLIGQLLDQSNLTCFYAQHCSLSNGENRSFLSCTYQKLFKKYPPAFFFETGNSLVLNYILDLISKHLGVSIIASECWTLTPFLPILTTNNKITANLIFDLNIEYMIKKKFS
jgi:hypothetical protein